MKIHTGFEQGSQQWLDSRAGVVTASALDAIISPTWKAKEGAGPNSYLCKLIAERWIGRSLDQLQTFDMDVGHLLESEARSLFSFQTDIKVEQVAFITDDAGRVGASPDGLIGEDSGLELKCPRPNTHVKYLLAGTLPPDYAAQVHGSMFVTGRSSWVFASYARKLPMFILKVERDEKIQSAIAEAVEAFLERMDDAWARLVEANGGPPEPRVVSKPTKPVEQFSDGDVIP